MTDTATGLIWQQHPGTPTAITWEEALAYCDNLVLAGHEDWRLPNINELQSIRDQFTSSTFPGPGLPRVRRIAS